MLMACLSLSLSLFFFSLSLSLSLSLFSLAVSLSLSLSHFARGPAADDPTVREIQLQTLSEPGGEGPRLLLRFSRADRFSLQVKAEMGSDIARDLDVLRVSLLGGLQAGVYRAWAIRGSACS